MPSSTKQTIPKINNKGEKQDSARYTPGIQNNNPEITTACRYSSRFRDDFINMDNGLYAINRSNAAIDKTIAFSVILEKMIPKISGATHIAHAPCSRGIKYLKVLDLNEKCTKSFRFKGVNFGL